MGVLPQPAPRRPAPLLRVEQSGLRGHSGLRGIPQAPDRRHVGVADASLAARRATQPIGTPDEIIEKIRTLQHAISLEMVAIHMFYGGMPRAKAEKSVRLFAEKVLPAVQAMPTPINPASLGRPKRS
jgi:alkanesulfonate monooxygenase SsuD/methylene tetrahydromethanopterin reductase-like flavin-dependent oxidoreductase (luciferase family)